MVLQVPGQSHNHYLILSSHSLSHQTMTVIVSVLLLGYLVQNNYIAIVLLWIYSQFACCLC